MIPGALQHGCRSAARRVERPEPRAELARLEKHMDTFLKEQGYE